MSQARAIRSLREITKKIKKTLTRGISPQEARSVGQFAIDLIVKRTRLGYGVSKQYGTKSRLKALSANYKKRRATFRGLSATTSPGKSNLTFTGQMLASMKLIKMQTKSGETIIRFGPTGSRRDSPHTNLEVAGFQEGQGRIFNRLSQLEFQQLLRFYRRNFGDLLRKSNLIR